MFMLTSCNDIILSMSKLFKRTKILATVGPSVFGEDKLKEMVYAGVNG